mgnify:CR=1 FL=1
MVGAKVEDRLHASVTWRSASKGARALWTTALSWCADQESDGVVPAGMLAVLEGTANDARSLVSAGLWEAVEGGYVFRKWSEYQPSRVDLEQRRADDAERKRKAREAKAGLRTAGVRSDSDERPDGLVAESSRSPLYPDPTRPDPTPTSTDVEVKTVPRKRGQRLDANWNPTGELVAEMRTELPGFDLHAEHRVFVDYWIAQPGQKGVKTDWDATWRNWMRRAARDAKGRRVDPNQRAMQTLQLATDLPGMREVEG